MKLEAGIFERRYVLYINPITLSWGYKVPYNVSVVLKMQQDVWNLRRWKAKHCYPIFAIHFLLPIGLMQ